MGDFSGQTVLKWDPKNLEIRTMSVEKTLEPLVLQVTTLVNTKGPSKKKKGKVIESCVCERAKGVVYIQRILFVCISISHQKFNLLFILLINCVVVVRLSSQLKK